MHWKLTLSYDGSDFHGWQVQPERATVQGTLSAALHQLTGETVLPQGSGRTDAGVHALAQIMSFSIAAPIPPQNLIRALNRALPPGIRVLSAEIVPETFHARYDARAKTYEYRIFSPTTWISSLGSVRTAKDPGFCSGQGLSCIEPPICPPFLSRYVWDCPWKLTIESMQQAATLLLGTHDFTSFAASDPDLTTRTSASKGTGFRPSIDADPKGAALASEGSFPNVRTLFTSTLTQQDDLLLYRVTGSGFLHHMVRNLVGTLVEVGRGALIPADIPRILAARDRSAAGPTAPPQGLFLVSVHYEENV